MKKAGVFLLHEIYGESYVHQQKKKKQYIYIYIILRVKIIMECNSLILQRIFIYRRDYVGNNERSSV